MNNQIICVGCGKEIDTNEMFYAHPDKPMHIECHEKTPEGIRQKEQKEEIKKNPYVEVREKKEAKRQKRHCWFHRNDHGEKIEAVCYWYTVDGFTYYACEDCAERYGKERKIHWYGERTGSSTNIIEPFDEDCTHDEYKYNMFTDEDDHGFYDTIACRKCGGKRKRRTGGS